VSAEDRMREGVNDISRKQIHFLPNLQNNVDKKYGHTAPKQEIVKVEGK
jgi:hypothetical protein